MSVLTHEAPASSRLSAASLNGFRVLGPEGWIGTVTEAHGEDCLVVRTGLFHPRWLTVLPSEIDGVDRIRGTVTLLRDPRDDGACG
jgi:hypothetical protein